MKCLLLLLLFLNLVVDIEKRSVPCLFNDNEKENDKSRLNEF